MKKTNKPRRLKPLLPKDWKGPRIPRQPKPAVFPPQSPDNWDDIRGPYHGEPTNWNNFPEVDNNPHPFGVLKPKEVKCKKGLTELVIIRDESGSMAQLVNDMEQGLTKYLGDQKKQKGQCNITFYRFDTTVERVLENCDLQYITPPAMNACGGTALFDAVGKAIDEVSARLYSTNPQDRPELVIVQIISDGEENSSRHVNLSSLQYKVKQQQDKYGWQFIFVGSNFDAWAKGKEYGFKGGKSIQYESSHDGVISAYEAASDMTCKMRFVAGDKGKLESLEFTEEQRDSAINK